MTDELITYDTGILAKEKKFDEQVTYYYNKKKALSCEEYEGMDWNWNARKEDLIRDDAKCSAPTQSLLQRWLREKHNLHVGVRFGFGQEVWSDFWIQKLECEQEVWEAKDFDGIADQSEKNGWPLVTYEQSLEAALQTALKLLP